MSKIFYNFCIKAGCGICLFFVLLLPRQVIGAITMYQITSTSGDDLSGTFEFSGSLDTDGTFNFDSSGNPLANPFLTVAFLVPASSADYVLTSSGSLSGSFTMDGVLSDGTNDFASDGSPLSSPSFTSNFGSFSNQPNQNDDYIVSGGVVTAMKYDLFDSNNLFLNADGTYTIQEDFSPLETGTYSLSVTSPSSSPGSENFTNLPNQNDNYVISGGSLTAMKYDLFNGSGYSLFLSNNGTFELMEDFETIASGTYEIAAVPEPETMALFAGIICIFLAFVRASHRRPANN